MRKRSIKKRINKTALVLSVATMGTMINPSINQILANELDQPTIEEVPIYEEPEEVVSYDESEEVIEIPIIKVEEEAPAVSTFNHQADANIQIDHIIMTERTMRFTVLEGHQLNWLAISEVSAWGPLHLLDITIEGNDVVLTTDSIWQNVIVLLEIGFGYQPVGSENIYMGSLTINQLDIRIDANAPDFGDGAEDIQTGWVQTGGTWFYYTNGTRATGWQRIDGVWYHFASNGAMQTGWQQINGNWFFMNNNGEMQTGWVQTGGNWFFMNNSGHMQTGWQRIDGVWYHFNNSGHMQTGWQQIDGVWYHFNNSGHMQTGWQQIGGVWYHFANSGAMNTGWQQIGGRWFFFGNSGAMRTGWVQQGNNWYFIDSDGIMQTGWVQQGNNWFFMNSSGRMQRGWVQTGGNWFFMNNSGQMQTGWQQINGVWHTFNLSGVWLGQGHFAPNGVEMVHAPEAGSTLVQLFPNNDEGFDRAFDLGEELEAATLAGNNNIRQWAVLRVDLVDGTWHYGLFVWHH